jgi:hypothetical protein
MNLDLRTALIFTKIDAMEADLPLVIQEKDEYLLCYELNPLQSHNIEPTQEHLLKNLVFTGRKTEEKANEGEKVSLPQGLYLFAQKRSHKALVQAEWLDMAVEQQKDGLWEREPLGNLLYIRVLTEDGEVVTQVFRVVN